MPDALSRLYCDGITADHPDILHVDLNDHTFSDPEYLELVKTLTENPAACSNLKVHNQRIYFRSNNSGITHMTSDLPLWKLYIPKALTITLIEAAHCPPTASHFGIKKTIENLQRLFYWPSMRHDVYEFIKICEICKECKAPNEALRPPMGEYYAVQRTWQKLYIDFLGPYPRSKDGNCFIFIVMDHLSRFVMLEPMRDANSKNVCKFLERRIFSVFSVPEIILSDNGKQFTSKLFGELMVKYGVQHKFTAKYHPQANACERVNRSIIAGIRAYIGESHNNWDKHLHSIAAAIRNITHDTTNESPHFVVFGKHYVGHGSDYELLRKLHNLGDISLDLTNSERHSLLQKNILERMKKAYEQSSKKYNLRSRDRPLSTGQTVYVRNFVQSVAVNKIAAKFCPKFRKGIIHKRIGNVAYEVYDVNGKSLGIFHAKDIRI